MITSSGPAGPYLSPFEFEQAVRALVGDAPWERLRAIACAECRRTRWPDPDDLLQEAFLRALEGSRQCPRHVDVVRFLGQAMRSIASDGVKAAKRRGDLGASEAGSGDQGTNVADVEPESEAPHRRMRQPSVTDRMESEQECTRMRKALVALFPNDPTAQTMVEGIIEGLDGEELRSLVDLDPVAFASKRRLIRRTIDAAFPEGWIP